MAAENKIVVKPTELQSTAPNTTNFRGCPGVPVHGGTPIVFISIHGVVTHSLMFRFFVYPYTMTQPNFRILNELLLKDGALPDSFVS